MKTIIIKVMAIIATVGFCGIPLNAVSKENKVKKVEYLGHMYEGQVNKDKVPEGNGTMNIGGLIIKGKFQGTEVSDAKVYMEKESDSFFRTTYSGMINYDQSNNVTLKATGNMTVCYFISKGGDSADYKPEESRRALEKLKEDQILNIENFNPEELTVSSYVPDLSLGGSFSKLNPPQVTLNNTVKPSKIRLAEQKDPNNPYASDNTTIKLVKAFIANPNDQKQKLEGYKDNEGRVWEYRRNKNQNRVKFKVTYPNGSYYYDDGMINHFQINYSDGRQLFYDKNLGYSIDNIIYLWPWDRYDPSDIFCNNINVFPTKGHLGMDTPKRVYVKSDKVSSSEIGDYIDKSINILLDNSETLKYVDNINSNNEIDNVTLGYMEDGRYVSKNDHDAAKAAADAKAEKARQAKLAPYIKRFGFNPSGKSIKQLVAVGRSFSLVNDYLNDYYVGGQNFWFSFAEDTGISKGYRVIMNNNRVGYIYVQNNRIISVTWR